VRVLHICQRDDPDTGGSLRVAEALVREQRRAGIDAWLLFLYGELAEVSASLAPHTVTLGLSSSRQAYKGVFKLRKAVWSMAPDIIHSHDGIIWPRLAFLLCATPLVMHTHLPMAKVSGLKDQMGRVLVKATTRNLVGISLHTIETWVRNKYTPSRIHYIPNGVDFSRFSIPDEPSKWALRERLGLPLDKRILLWVGRIHREMKGSDRVERVAKLLPDDMVLVVVGNGPDFAAMRENCAEQVANGNVVLVGSANNPEFYYQAADEFLFTSYHEPFGLVILEAVASGLPILSFEVTLGGGAAKLLQEVGATMVDDSFTDESIKAHLEHAPPLYESAIESRARALERYNWGRVSGEVVDVYKLVLRKRI
jgi:glycosyltransferase involved in cell wall biosynthesis